MYVTNRQSTRSQIVGSNPACPLIYAMAEHSGRSGLFNAARESWRETLAEWRKVQWPTQAQAKNLTLVVLVVMTTMSVLLGMCDFIFGYLLEEIVAMNIIAIIIGVLIIISIIFIIFLSPRSR